MRLSFHHFLPSILLTIPTFVHADPEPEPEPQLAQGGGIAAAPPPPTQFPTTSIVPSLTTDVNGVVTTVWITFTQTFASTALGSWWLGPTPLAGTIGL